MKDSAHGKRDFGSVMLKKFDELEKRTGLRLDVTQKVLLAETGTLEQLLSILAGEPIVVRIEMQRERGGIILRKSSIGSKSGRILVLAHSRILVENIPSKFARLLRSQQGGIGSIIQALELETFRRITEIGYDPRTKNLFRKYQILVRKKVGFEIREEFVK